MTGAAAAAGQACLQHCEGAELSGDGFCWLGLFNVLMLVAFLPASLRHDRSGDAGAERSPGEEAAPASGVGPDGTAPRTGSGTPAPPTDRRPPPRASDAEREATAATVRRAMAEGRLTLDEGVARLDAAFAARHRGQLDELVADLPSEPERRPNRWSGAARDLRDFAVLAVVAASVLQAMTGLWVLWPIAVGALVPLALVGHRLPGARGRPVGDALPGGDRRSGGDGAWVDGSRRLPPA